MKMHLNCGICRQTLEIDVTDESWGTIAPTDIAIAQVTINEPAGTINAHMSAHRAEGEWLPAYEDYIRREQERAAAYFASKAERTGCSSGPF